MQSVKTMGIFFSIELSPTSQKSTLILIAWMIGMVLSFQWSISKYIFTDCNVTTSYNECLKSLYPKSYQLIYPFKKWNGWGPNQSYCTNQRCLNLHQKILTNFCTSIQSVKLHHQQIYTARQQRQCNRPMNTSAPMKFDDLKQQYHKKTIIAVVVLV